MGFILCDVFLKDRWLFHEANDNIGSFQMSTSNSEYSIDNLKGLIAFIKPENSISILPTFLKKITEEILNAHIKIKKLEQRIIKYEIKKK